MNRFMKYHFAYRMAITMVCMVVFPIWLHGQDTPKEKASDGKYEWTETKLKDAGKHLKEVNDWQAAINEYEMEEAERVRLETEAGKKEAERDRMDGQLKEAQRMIQSLCSEKKERDWFKKMYAQYDTTLLLQVKGHFGDEKSEKVVEELMACHRAEALLSFPYNAARVTKASEVLKSMEKEGKAGLNQNIASRLDQYKEMTDNLREILLEAQEAIKLSAKGASSLLKNQDRETFCNTIASKLDPSLFDSQSFPYLYGVLMEALETKMDDPSNKIDNIINKL